MAGSYPAKTKTPKVSPSAAWYLVTWPVLVLRYRRKRRAVSPDTSSTTVLVRTVIFSWFRAASAVAWAQVKSVAPDQDGHMAGVLGEEHALLGGRKAAAHHKDVLAGEELAVAGGAVGHAPAPELLLPLEAHHAGMGAGGQQDAEAFQVAPAGPHGFHIAGEVQAGDLRQQEFRAEGLPPASAWSP